MILQKGGTLSWTFQKLGLGSVNVGYSNTAMWIVFSYIWLPFMIVPIYGALERIPDSLLEASGDLGAHGGARCAASRCRSPCRAWSRDRSLTRLFAASGG